MKLDPMVVAQIRRILAECFPMTLLEITPDTSSSIADVFRLTE
jgi:hypothetical protein